LKTPNRAAIPPGETRVLTSTPFDEAYRIEAESGTELAYFKTNMTEGVQSIKKKLEVNVKHGLALWAKAISAVTSSAHLLTPEEADALENKAFEDGTPAALQDAAADYQDGVKSEEEIPPSVEAFARIDLTERTRSLLMYGLAFLESLSFGTARDMPRLPFSYEPGESLTVGHVQFYNRAHRVIVCILNEDGQSLGYHLIQLFHLVIELGEQAKMAKAANPDKPGSNLRFPSTRPVSCLRATQLMTFSLKLSFETAPHCSNYSRPPVRVLLTSAKFDIYPRPRQITQHDKPE